MKPIFFFLVSIFLCHYSYEGHSQSILHPLSGNIGHGEPSGPVIPLYCSGAQVSPSVLGTFTDAMAAGFTVSAVSDRELTGSALHNLHTLACDPAWKYATLENKIGPRLLNTLDIDKDGITEIIASTPNYWYTLKYDPVKDTVGFDYISGMFDQGISCFAAFDINSDSISEIFVGVGGDIYLYDGLTKALTLKLPCTSQFGRLLDMEFGDADNDGNKELVCCDYYNIYVINTGDYSLEQLIPYGDYDFEIGNVDADPYLEIVTCHGKVLQNVGQATTLQWTCSTTNMSWEYLVHLSDIDQDGMAEIVLMSEKNLSVYDADVQTQKYQLTEDWKILQFIMKDVNSDGVDEIVYGGDSYDIVCVDAVTKQQLWIMNGNGELDAVNIFDVDADGALDVIWFAGGMQGNAALIDFRIADMATKQLKSRSYQVPGRFDQIATADIDSDGAMELIVLNASEKVLDENLMIFDAATHQLEWLSPPDFFSVNGHNLSPRSFIVNDIDKDGIMEIVLIGGTGSAVIAYMNGLTKQIGQYHFYNNAPFIGDFGLGTIADVDNDGSDEIIVSGVSRYYSINPSDFSIKYESANYFPNVYGQLSVSNIDSDDEKEIVYCKQKLYVIGGQSHNQQVIDWKEFSVFDLYDMDSDGKKEIVAGTNDGYVYTISGGSLLKLSEIRLSSKRITGLVVADLNNDARPEFIATSDGKVIIYSDSLHYINSAKLDQSEMYTDGLVVADMDSDLKYEILFGGTYQLNQLNDECYRCMWFDTGKVIETVSCGNGADGSVWLMPAGGKEPYSFLWNTGANVNPLTNLSPGTYIATITDQIGCVISDTSDVKQAVLSAGYSTTNESCIPGGDGSASVSIIEGTEPITFIWNTGDTTAAIVNRVRGEYTVSVHDAKQCSIDKTLIIEKDTLVLQHTQNNIVCNGYANGSVVIIPSGNPPFTYAWNTGANTGSISFIPAGTYTVEVHDGHGCVAGDSITITQPAALVTEMQSTPDLVSTLIGDGIATAIVSGGTPPYSYKWSDPLGQFTPTATNLLSGIYSVRVRDAHFCLMVDTVVVEETNSLPEISGLTGVSIFPNPGTGVVYLEFGSPKPKIVTITVYDAFGKMQRELPVTTEIGHKTPVDLTGLKPGFYFLKLIASGGSKVFKIEIVR